MNSKELPCQGCRAAGNCPVHQLPPKNSRPVAGTLVIMLIIAACCLGMAFMCSCQHAPKRTGVDLGSNIKRSQDITETISLAESDSKEIKRAIGALQASNKVLRTINGQQVLILDRADYKTAKLLGK